MLLATVGIVVLVSTGIHGASSTPIGAWYRRRAKDHHLMEEATATADSLIVHHGPSVMLITPEQLYQLISSPRQPMILDVRSRASYERAISRIPGSIRVEPDKIDQWVNSQENIEGLVVAYCTWHRESSSVEAAGQLNAWGITAATLSGGIDAWTARYPYETIEPGR